MRAGERLFYFMTARVVNLFFALSLILKSRLPCYLGGEGPCFLGYPQYGCRGWSPNFGRMCMWEGEALVLLIFAEIMNVWSLTLFFWDKLIIYTQKSLFTHKTNIWTPRCNSQNQIKSLLIFAFELFLKILFSE